MAEEKPIFNKKDLLSEKYKELTLDDGQTSLIMALHDLTTAIRRLIK